LEAHRSRRSLRLITAGVAASLSMAFAGHALAPIGAAAQTVPAASVSAPAAAPVAPAAPVTVPGTVSTVSGIVSTSPAGWVPVVTAILATLSAAGMLWCAAGGAGC
jgi:hypothetical protein